MYHLKYKKVFFKSGFPLKDSKRDCVPFLKRETSVSKRNKCRHTRRDHRVLKAGTSAVGAQVRPAQEMEAAHNEEAGRLHATPVLPTGGRALRTLAVALCATALAALLCGSRSGASDLVTSLAQHETAAADVAGFAVRRLFLSFCFLAPALELQTDLVCAPLASGYSRACRVRSAPRCSALQRVLRAARCRRELKHGFRRTRRNL